MAQLAPRDLFDHPSATQTKKALPLADPDIACAVPGHGMHVAWDSADGREPAIFKKGDSAMRGHPNPILKVLKEGLDRIIGQSTCGYVAHAPWAARLALPALYAGFLFSVGVARSCFSPLAINSKMAIIPSVQAMSSAEPDAAIPDREDGFNDGIRQTLLDRNRGDCEVAKAVEAIQRWHPNVTFAILEEHLNEVA